MIIINKGTAQVEGYVNELLDANKLKVTVEVNDIEKARVILNESEWSAKIDSFNNYKIILNLQPGESSEINKFLIRNGIDVIALIPVRSLEEFFLNITEKETK